MELDNHHLSENNAFRITSSKISRLLLLSYSIESLYCKHYTRVHYAVVLILEIRSMVVCGMRKDLQNI